MKFGIRTPSFTRRVAARTSVKRVVRHNLGLKAPRGMGWVTNPKRAAYNRVYSRSTVGLGRAAGSGCSSGVFANLVLCAIVFNVFVQGPVDKLVSWCIPSAAAWWIVLGGPPLLLLAIGGFLLRRAWKRSEAEEVAAAAAQEQRRLALCARYGPEMAARVMSGEVWKGQSWELLREALGEPDVTSQRVLKTKSKTTCKYFPDGRKHLLHVTLDDDVVVKWLDRRPSNAAAPEDAPEAEVVAAGADASR